MECSIILLEIKLTSEQQDLLHKVANYDTDAFLKIWFCGISYETFERKGR